MTAWNVSMHFTNTSAALSAMLVEAEAEEAERTEQALESEKSRIREAAEAEYEANLEAAEDMERAAWIGGAFAIASGSLSVYGATAARGTSASATAEAGDPIAATADRAREEMAAAERAARPFQSAGAALGQLTPTARALGGEVAAERERAKAQRIGRSIEQAEVLADQLAERVRRSEQRADSAISRAESFVEGENARANGVLSNF